MKKLLFLGLTTLLLGGCSALPVEIREAFSLQSSPSPSPPSPSPLPPPPTPRSCPEKPGQLLPENLKTLSFTTDRPSFVVSDAVSPARQIGYSFNPRPGSQLSYQVGNEKICIWFYDGALNLMNPGQIQSPAELSFDLTDNFPYTLQIASLKGQREVNLNITVLMPLEEAEAVQLVKRWLDAKSRIFAPPYDQDLAAQLTTGTRYEQVKGSIQWLRDYQGEWKFNSQSVKPTGKFSSDLDAATIEVIVSEDRELYVNGKLDDTHTPFATDISRDRFEFIRESGQWKIINYKSMN